MTHFFQIYSKTSTLKLLILPQNSPRNHSPKILVNKAVILGLSHY